MSEYGYRIEVYEDESKYPNFFQMKGDNAKPIIECIENNLKNIAGYTFGEVDEYKSRIMKLPFVGGHWNSRQLFIYYLVEKKTYRIIVMDYENNLKDIENLLIMKNETTPSPFTNYICIIKFLKIKFLDHKFLLVTLLKQQLN